MSMINFLDAEVLNEALAHNRGIPDTYCDYMVRRLALTDDGVVRVLDIAYNARTQMKLQYPPLLMLSVLAEVNSPITRSVLADGIEHVLQSSDDMSYLIRIWKRRNLKKSPPREFKEGLGRVVLRLGWNL